jgi:hypothetical protein
MEKQPGTACPAIAGGLGIVAIGGNSDYATQYGLCFSLKFNALNPYRVVTPLLLMIYYNI